MKKMAWKRLLCVGILAGLGIGILTGCNEEKKVDYAIEGITEENSTRNDVGKSGVAQFKEEERWEETWTTKAGTMELEGRVSDLVTDVVVDAKISVPEAEQMSVIEVEEPEFDAEYKEQIAKRLFDNEEIYYGYTLVDYIPKKDLLELISTCKELIATADGEEKQMWQETLEGYEAALDTAKDTRTLVDRYTENEYTGMYEGQLYDLSFVEEDGDTVDKRRTKYIIWAAHNLYDICPEEFKNAPEISCSPWMQGDLYENKCEISEEEALKEAKRFVEKMGLDYSVVSYTRPLMWGNPPEDYFTTSEDEPDNWGVNGYVFSFDVGVDDISFVEFGIEQDYNDFWVMTKEEEERRYSLNAQLQVYVTDEGIIQMIANNPLEMTGASENVELLPMDTIKSIIKEEMEQQWETFRFDNSVKNFDGMELIYFRVRDKENPGKYSYVPTWRLATVTKDEVLHLITIRQAVLINAIDGSVIDFYDET